VTDHKKKGDFDKAPKHDVGGNKKQHSDGNSDSRTGNQNSGHGGTGRPKRPRNAPSLDSMRD